MPRMTARQASAFYRALAAHQRAELVTALEETAKEARQELVDKSSGTLSLETLRRMGHPFARRKPQPALADPTVINDQGGGFREAWEALPVETSETGATVRIVNRHEDAQWMQGTARMIPRRIVAAVRLIAYQKLRVRLAQARRFILPR